MASNSKLKVGKTKTITQLSNRMISIECSLNVIHLISHLIRADKRRITQFINGAKMLEALLEFPNDSALESGWNWIPLSYGSIRDI